MIRRYLSGITNDYKTQGEQKIIFFSSKDSEETRTMYSWSDSIEVMVVSETDDITEDHFDSILQRYQKNLEKSMRGSEFVFDSVDSLYYKLQKISLNRDVSYIDSPKWLKDEKATINPKNNDDKCFQYALAVALNYEQIKSHPGRIQNIKPFIDQYNWKEINFLSNKKDWNEFGKNNKSIALNILYVPYNTEEMRHAYKSKYNLNRENQVLLLMITDGEKWNQFGVKKLSALLRGITSNIVGNFYCLNCLHTYRTKDKLKKHENVCKNYDYFNVDMPNKDNRTLKYNHGKKSMKVQFIIYADLKFLLEKMRTHHNNSEKSSTT